MKRKITLLFSLLACAVLASCGGANSNESSSSIATEKSESSSLAKGEYKITLETGNGETLEVTSVNRRLPSDITVTKANATFKGWYEDYYYSKEFSSNNLIYSNITLYAKWDLNYGGILTDLYQSSIKSNVKVTAKSYNKVLGAVSSSTTAIGSGVIFKSDTDSYYALTNNHVIYKSDDYNYSELKVNDCYGNEYSASVVYNMAEYDLAIIKFTNKTAKELAVIEMADKNPIINTEVIAIGSPEGLFNASSFGFLTSYRAVQTDVNKVKMSNVTFDVLANSAEIKNGSSGGALLDTNFKLVGINYASQYQAKSGEYLSSFTIPIEKVKEFISLANIEV